MEKSVEGIKMMMICVYVFDYLSSDNGDFYGVIYCVVLR